MEEDIRELYVQTAGLKASCVALQLSLAATLALIMRKWPDAEAKLDILENDLLIRTITVLSREDIPLEFGQLVRSEVLELLRETRKNLGLPD
jgi:hypothetical protein